MRSDVVPARATVDLAAVRANVAVLVEAAAPAAVLAVVKADGYGHGMLPCAEAALAGGASWLGVATLDEALALRAAGINAPTLAWLLTPGEPLADAITADVDLSISTGWALEEVQVGAREAGRPARIHLKIDTGLSRGGATAAAWPDLVEAAAKAQADGTVHVVGVWSHFVFADAPEHPVTSTQTAAFSDALDAVLRAGLRPELSHLANSAATLTRPDTHFDLVRPGLAVYGLSPVPTTRSAAELGLTPAMTLSARVALVKRVPAGRGVSYGHRYTTMAETTLALVPLGYGDGVPRAASNTVDVLLAGHRRRIAGTVCMDQFVLDVGDDPVCAGDEVLLFGPGSHGEPTAQDWADQLDTISYEIVTRLGRRLPIVYRP